MVFRRHNTASRWDSNRSARSISACSSIEEIRDRGDLGKLLPFPQRVNTLRPHC